MGIFTSGTSKPVFLKCIDEAAAAGSGCNLNELYEMVLDMGAMVIIKMPNGEEGIVTRSAFEVAEGS